MRRPSNLRESITPSALPRFLGFSLGILLIFAFLGMSASLLHPWKGLAAGVGAAILFLLMLFANQNRLVLHAVGAKELEPSVHLKELLRRVTVRLAALESVESKGLMVEPRGGAIRLAVFDHGGSIVLVLRGWSSSSRFLAISRDLLNRMDEEFLIQSLMEGIRALDRREVAYRTTLAAAATVLCRLLPLHRMDGPDPGLWGVSKRRLILSLGVLPFYSFLAAPGLGELSTGQIAPWLRQSPLSSRSTGDGIKRELRRELRRALGHLPAHLGQLALWHSGGAKNVLSAFVEAR